MSINQKACDIQQKSDIKYLGIFIDGTLKWDTQIHISYEARGPYWENIGPRADILPVRFRASLVNKRFITRLKKALKVFHKFHVTLCGKCYLARTLCFHSWSWFTIIRSAFENF